MQLMRCSASAGRYSTSAGSGAVHTGHPLLSSHCTTNRLLSVFSSSCTISGVSTVNQCQLWNVQMNVWVRYKRTECLLWGFMMLCCAQGCVLCERLLRRPVSALWFHPQFEYRDVNKSTHDAISILCSVLYGWISWKLSRRTGQVHISA